MVDDTEKPDNSHREQTADSFDLETVQQFESRIAKLEAEGEERAGIFQELLKKNRGHELEAKRLEIELRKMNNRTFMICFLALLGAVVFVVLALFSDWGEIFAAAGALGFVSVALKVGINYSRETQTNRGTEKESFSTSVSLEKEVQESEDVK